MASAKTGTSNGVDFTLLEDIETGDIFTIRFRHNAIMGVTELMKLIGAGIVTSPDELVLRTIMEGKSWVSPENRLVRISSKRIDNFFDLEWFQQRMEEYIDKLEVTSRKRPLVDLTALAQLEASVRYRFKTDGLSAVGAMLDLHEMGVLELGAADLLRAALEAGKWGDAPRAGHFTNRLDGEYLQYFTGKVAPCLELLRT